MCELPLQYPPPTFEMGKPHPPIFKMGKFSGGYYISCKFIQCIITITINYNQDIYTTIDITPVLLLLCITVVMSGNAQSIYTSILSIEKPSHILSLINY